MHSWATILFYKRSSSSTEMALAILCAVATVVQSHPLQPDTDVEELSICEKLFTNRHGHINKEARQRCSQLSEVAATSGRSKHSVCGDGLHRQIVAHHKAGTEMSRAMARHANEALNVMCKSHGVDDGAPHVDVDTIGLGAVGEPKSGKRAWLDAKRLSVVQVARNAFEMVASEYAYDLANSEPWWMEMPMDCAETNRREHANQSPRFCAGIMAVRKAAMPGGELHLVLPWHRATHDTMSWGNYLRSLPENMGLLATAILMRPISLLPMHSTRKELLHREHHSRRRTADFFFSAESQSDLRYVLACESEFDDARTQAECSTRWNSLFVQAGFAFQSKAAKAQDSIQCALDAKCRSSPTDLEMVLLTAAAAKSCPATGDHANAHADRHSMYSNEGTASRRVHKLRFLDKKYLNGSLHALEAAVPCKVSERYQLIDGDQ